MPAPLALQNTAAPALRCDLSNYNAQTIAERLGPVAASALHRDDPLPARMHLEGETDQLALQIRLFLLAEALTGAQIETALPTLGRSGASAAGLIHAIAEHWQATVTISAHQGLLVASDWLAAMRQEGRQLGAEHVLGVGGASQTLRNLLPNVQDQMVLDLGTGCGIQALTLAAGGANGVVATDISQRACQFAEFNAALNPASTPIEVRCGDLFTPVRGQTFDLVVSNPPFVITPQRAYEAGLPHFEYRDANVQAGGDALIWQLLEQLPAVLHREGVAVMLANWELDALGQPQQLRCPDELDLLLVKREVQDPAQYATMWLRDAGIGERSELWRRVYLAYLADFASRNVAALAFGYVFAARREAGGAGLRRQVEAASAPVLGATDWWALFGTERWLHSAGDTAIAEAHLVARSDVRVEHHFAVGDDQVRSLYISNPRGINPRRRCDQVVAGLVSACDGQLSVAQIAGALAALLDADENEMRSVCIAAARQLLANGDVRVAEHTTGVNSPVWHADGAM